MALKTAVPLSAPQSPLVDLKTGQTNWIWIKWFQGIQSSLANVPTVTFGLGVPIDASREGYLYFDTTGSPYHGYVWHSGAWHIFS